MVDQEGVVTGGAADIVYGMQSVAPLVLNWVDNCVRQELSLIPYLPHCLAASDPTPLSI